MSSSALRVRIESFYGTRAGPDVFVKGPVSGVIWDNDGFLHGFSVPNIFKVYFVSVRSCNHWSSFRLL